MMDKPLSDYQLTVENPKRMREDGSIPENMLAQYREEKRLAAEAAETAEKAELNKIAARWPAKAVAQFFYSF